MKKNKKTIQVGDWVKIIKESKTTGLLGAQLKVISANEGSVEVIVGKSKIKFQFNEVMPMTFKVDKDYEKAMVKIKEQY